MRSLNPKLSIFVENCLANFFFFLNFTRLPRPLQATWNRYNLKVCQILLDRGADPLWQCFGGLLSTQNKHKRFWRRDARPSVSRSPRAPTRARFSGAAMIVGRVAGRLYAGASWERGPWSWRCAAGGQRGCGSAVDSAGRARARRVISVVCGHSIKRRLCL